MSEFAWPSVIGPLMAGESLTEEQAFAAMSEIMAGAATPAQISAFIIALRAKGESVEEISGLVRAMRDAAVPVEVSGPVVDTAGTGGDGAGTFNISTLAAFVAAGAGARIAKHGNRAASSRCGSADLLEAMGIALDLEPWCSAQMVEEVGFGFFFAPRYHPAMRHAGPIRTELGVPTVFNFLGPLANPAGATRQAVGVGDSRMAERMAGALAALGSERALVFFGHDGLDELTTTSPSTIYRLEEQTVTVSEITPHEFDLAPADPADLVGGTVADNVAIAHAVLGGEQGPKRDISLLNAAAAIVAAGLADSLAAGLKAAAESIDSGAAASISARAVEMSNRLAASSG